MKKILVVIAVLISFVAVYSAWQRSVEEAYKQELSRINRCYIYGEEQLSKAALAKGELKWIRARPNRKVARALFIQRLEKLHSKYNF